MDTIIKHGQLRALEVIFKMKMNNQLPKKKWVFFRLQLKVTRTYTSLAFKITWIMNTNCNVTHVEEYWRCWLFKLKGKLCSSRFLRWLRCIQNLFTSLCMQTTTSSFSSCGLTVLPMICCAVFNNQLKLHCNKSCSWFQAKIHMFRNRSIVACEGRCLWQNWQGKRDVS